MGIYLGNKEIINIAWGGVNLSKIALGNKIIWQRIKHMTGNLYNPTSNTTPPPFVVTDWSSGAYGGDGSEKAWKLFGSGYYAKKANASGQRCGAQIMFNTSAEIYPIKITYDGGNEDAGGGGGGGHFTVQVCLENGQWVQKANSSNSGTITMDGKTRVIGIRGGEVYSNGPEKYLEARSCQVTEWNQKGNI